MKRIKFIQFIFFTVVSVTMSCNETDKRYIQPWHENPYYWQYKGEPLLLLGGSDDDNLFQWDKFALAEQLDLLASVGGNYIRNTMSSRDLGNEEPFMRLDNGLFNLDQWNPVYWEYFENLLKLAFERDIIVQVELWDPHDWYDGAGGHGWEYRPFNPANNINYTFKESGLISVIDWNAVREKAKDHPFFHTVYDDKDMSITLYYQERFVEKVLEVSLSYPNVLYCVSNETANDIAWSIYWLDFIRETAARSYIPVYVGEMLVSPSSAIVSEYGFDYADLSQSASGLHREPGSNFGEGHFITIANEVDRLTANPSPLNSVKQYGGDLGWTRGPDEGVERFWRSIFGGQASVRFHRPTGGIGLNERSQANIKSLRMITDGFNLKKVQPHQKLEHLFLKREPNDAFIMGEEGKIYAVFFTSSGREIELDISALKGRALVRWLNPNTAEWLDEQLFTGNSTVLTKPGEGQWVVQITAK